MEDSTRRTRIRSGTRTSSRTGSSTRTRTGNDDGINVDGWVLTEPGSKVYAAGREQKVALLIGNNSQEMQPSGAPGDIRQMISQRYGPLADRALAVYGVNGAGEPQPDPENGTVMLQFNTDNTFRCGTVQELIWHTAAGNTGYEYQFSRTVHGQEAHGAPHASEIPFTFGTLSVWQQMRKYDESDQPYAPQMQEYWTNFAKTGDPNGGKLVKWPSSMRPRVHIWISPMPARWPKKACGGKPAICLWKTKTGRYRKRGRLESGTMGRIWGGLLGIISSVAFGQQAPAPVPTGSPEALFHTTARLGQVSVVAEDKQGKPLPDLRRDEFQIFDNGSPQNIQLFLAETENPKLAAPETKAQHVHQPDGRIRRIVHPLLGDFGRQSSYDYRRPGSGARR
jgi:hypothetical protein